MEILIFDKKKKKKLIFDTQKHKYKYFIGCSGPNSLYCGLAPRCYFSTSKLKANDLIVSGSLVFPSLLYSLAEIV